MSETEQGFIYPFGSIGKKITELSVNTKDEMGEVIQGMSAESQTISLLVYIAKQLEELILLEKSKF